MHVIEHALSLPFKVIAEARQFNVWRRSDEAASNTDVEQIPRTPRSRRSWRRTPSRPAAGAPVSAPITWDELDDPDLRPDRWTIREMPERVERVGDLFAPAQTDAQELPEV